MAGKVSIIILYDVILFIFTKGKYPHLNWQL